MRWLITNRNQSNDDGFGGDLDGLTFWTLDPATKPGAKIDARSSWTLRTGDEFKTMLIAVAGQFPRPVDTPPEKQKHLTLFVHGYDDTWPAAVQRYDTVWKQMYDGGDSLGELISFDCRRKDRCSVTCRTGREARKTADDLTNVLQELYDWMSGKQVIAAMNPDDASRAETSIIAHSMGNYALE